jgi:protein EFR3
MRSSFESIDYLKGWESLDSCCWFARKTAEWAQYQYRYAVPTLLIDRTVDDQEATTVAPMHKTLVAMATSIFNSPTPLINLSTSDIITNLLALLTRRISIDFDDTLLPDLVQCISSLGSHIYYSDQIQDLAVSRMGKGTS